MSDETSASPWIVNVTQANFTEEVLERSKSVPVVVDFWAAWCHPCRLIGPILEKLAFEMDGKFILAKVDGDANQELVAGCGVNAFPTLLAVRDGQLVDQAVGALAEPQLRAWVESLLPSPAQVALTEGRVLLQSDPAAAETKFREALQLDEKLDVAKIALAQALAAQKKTAAVNEILADLETRGYLEPEAESLKAQLSLDQMATDGPSLDSARAAVAADPKNPAPQFALAEALVANRQYEEALDLCLDLVVAGDARFAPQAKKAMIDLFQVLGESPLVTKYRRRLSSAVI